MRGGPMCLERGLVFVDLVEVVRVRVGVVLQHVEAITARLVALGAERVLLDRGQEARALGWLHADLHPDREHGSAPARERAAQELPGKRTRGLAITQDRLAVD